MISRYNLCFANVKMSGFGHSKSKDKFLFKIVMFNYPATYRYSLFKYCISSNLFESYLFYRKVKRNFKNNKIIKKYLTIVISDLKTNCPRALGIVNSGEPIKEEFFMLHQGVSLDYISNDVLSKYLWVDLYNDFDFVEFEKLRLD